MTNYTHLCKEQRNTIEHLLGLNKSFTYISNAIKVDRTTVSKEIRRNRYIKSNFYEPFNKKGIASACWKCTKLLKVPYVCNPCTNKRYCDKHKLYYNANMAHQNYNFNLVESRVGVDIDYTTIEEIENSIVPLIKDKNQSVNQVYIIS